MADHGGRIHPIRSGSTHPGRFKHFRDQLCRILEYTYRPPHVPNVSLQYFRSFRRTSRSPSLGLWAFPTPTDHKRCGCTVRSAYHACQFPVDLRLASLTIFHRHRSRLRQQADKQQESKSADQHPFFSPSDVVRRHVDCVRH